ncbi:MAG: GTP-binding protein [Thermoplasmata archaeon]|nr:GTP-binding protein [Thermoplasmata archaeon]
MEVRRVKRKVLMLGDGAVGKTSLIHKYVMDKFDDKYITTIGTKITKKVLELEHGEDRVDLTLMIWDILGQKGYTSIQTTSYKGGEGALMICDLTRKETLAGLEEYWIPEVQKVKADIPFIFVGNKADLVDQRQITNEDMEALASKYNTTYFLSSAKTGENVESMFIALGESVIAAEHTSTGGTAVAQREITDLVGVTDRIINDFCDSFGDRETAMAMIRQQFSRAGVDVKGPVKANLLVAVENLAEVEKGFKDDFKVKTELAKRKRLIEEFG